MTTSDRYGQTPASSYSSSRMLKDAGRGDLRPFDAPFQCVDPSLKTFDRGLELLDVCPQPGLRLGDLVDPLLDPAEPLVELTQVVFDAVQSLFDLVQSLFDLAEPVFDLVEPGLNLLQ